MGKESKLSIISAHSLEIERITFFHLVFTVEDRGETKTLDAIFIESAPDVRWLPIGPGLDLDGFAISLENRGRLPNLHSTDATFVWAALALISAVPPFIPIIFEHPISFLEPPVSDGDLTAPAPWRRWTISRGPEDNLWSFLGTTVKI